MKSAIIKMFIVIALLSVQVSGSFASVQMPCSDEVTTSMRHDSRDMMKHSSNDDMEDCCNQDCCCPVAMFQVALVPGYSGPSQDGLTLSIQSHNSNLHQIFLSAFQRPPKPSLS